MPINEKDQQQLAELFRRTTKGGTDATTATRLFNEKASALGLDSFKLYNSFVQGGSLTVYQPPQPPAVSQPKAEKPTPKTQTSTGGPSAGHWPDMVKIRLHCSKDGKSSLATFHRSPGASHYTVRSLVKEQAAVGGNGTLAPATKGFPTALLDWSNQSCPHCNGNIYNAKEGPVSCPDCEKMYCHAGIYSSWGRRRFRCPCCGTDGVLGPVSDKLMIDVVQANPQPAAVLKARSAIGSRPALPPSKNSTPALPAAYDPIALPAPGRRR